MIDYKTAKNTLDSLKNKRILAIGDATLDRYVKGKVNRISPDAPVPLLAVDSDIISIGGIGRIIQNILNLEGQVDIVTCVGDDFEGNSIIDKLKKLNIGIDGIIQLDISTPMITRFSTNQQQLLRVEKDYKLSREIIPILNSKIIAYIETRISLCDVLLILDYGIGLLSSILISQIISLAHKHNKKIIVRPETGREMFYQNSDILSMNRREACTATKMENINETSVRIMGTKLKNFVQSKKVFIPWIEGDSYYFDSQNVGKISSLLDHPPKYTRNIGSATLAILSLVISAGHTFINACELGVLAGTIAALKDDISKNDLLNLLKN